MHDITALFCTIDDFFLKFETLYWEYLKQFECRTRLRHTNLNLSEIILIAIWYKISHFSNFKAFYSYLKHTHADLFRCMPCYQRMVDLINMHKLALHALHFALMKGNHSSRLWIDSTTLPVCKNQRIQRHKSLTKIASRGKSSMGWFFGCKLHVVMNAAGKLINTVLSNGHIADIKMVEKLVTGLNAKLYADRGYISKELRIKLKNQSVDLITYQRKNMQTIELSKEDVHYLRQRNKIETLFSLLKGQYNLVTSKARSISGYLSGIYASLCAYQICHKNKPTIKMI